MASPVSKAHHREMAESIVPPSDEHLTDGWEPDLPADDTLVRQAVLVHASWPLDLATALHRPRRRTDHWAGAHLGGRGALTNAVVLLQPLADPDVLGEVDEIVPPSVPYFLLSAWPTPDLTGQGLALLGHPPLMVRFPSPGGIPEPEGVEVREVTNAADLAVAERVLVDGYPMPDLEPLSPGDLLAPGILGGPTRVWLAYADEEPAAVAAAHVHAGLVLVEYVAALPSARGRGAGASVAWAATLADPSLPAVLVASDDGRPVYEHMGYVAIERWTAWLRPGT